ncbi:MAG TPA: SpoIIE family protein phosphatase [Phycisphaerae bacterium]|nr:SpoIIE family protein phosphatase [Phycisphaerales bacterium]HRX87152.1 SpoIIE family protein phosphatase [Phycisphaerae bacterium]
MNRPLHVLLVDGANALPAGVGATLDDAGYLVSQAGDFAAAVQQARRMPVDAAVLVAPAPGDAAGTEAFAGLLRTCEVRGTAAIVLGEPERFETESPHLISFAANGSSTEEIKGRLAMVAHYHRIVRSMEGDLDNMQRLFKQLNVRFTEVDQEMRLAGRLQTAFLPNGPREIGPLRFSALYRPATFVSGDIYDMYRVDEETVAFYVADAVGHGMAASLLTMFIKNAAVSKIIHDDGYEILNPDRTLQMLNRRLVEQQLPNSQFVTACFATLNLNTLDLQFARAGHPYPLHCTVDGTITELKSPGGLLGLFEDEEFPEHRVRLQPGEKVILYTDGVELAFASAEGRENELTYYREVFTSLATLPADRFVQQFGKLLDTEAGSLNPQDDLTLLVMEVAE